MNDQSENNCILIIDDDFINRELLKNIFSPQFSFEEAANGREGLELIEKRESSFCAIILDVEMPEMTGIELLEIISGSGVTERVPTFLITAHDDDALVEKAYSFGVMDVVSKPVTPVVIQRRVKTVIELFSARERLNETVKGQEIKIAESERAMDDLQRGTLEALATAIEFRDMESGNHVSRIYAMTKYILAYTSFGEGLSASDIENIARGSIMHDVGKIAISDLILNKPGRLTKEEFEVMKTHTVKGAQLLGEISEIQTQETYRYACDIARHHHERWDGRGYPDGLKGDEISVAAQVVSIVDVYDALVSERVYKKAFSPDEAVNMIKNGECGVFNPQLVECFLEAEPEIRKWYTDGGDAMLEELTGDTAHMGERYAEAASGATSVPSSVTDVMLLMTAVQTAYDMIIYVNLTQNSYYMIDYDRFLTHCADSDGVFDDLIEQGSASVPVSHRREFHDTFCRENLLRAFADGKKAVRLEHLQYSDDGQLHHVLTKVLFMRDARTGDVLQITLSQYLDDEYAERERNRKILSDALNLAEQANNAKFDFLSKMSHDIRTPLNAIIGMTTIIAAHLGDEEKINDCLVKIGVSSRYLLGIVNDVLDYSRLENGSLAIHNTDFNLRDMVADISNDISFRADGKQQNVNIKVDEEVGISYVGDEFRIRQVLSHLLDNAHKYTSLGGSFSLDVSISRRTQEYDVLSFAVRDSGRGIRKEFIDRIFEPFAQDSSSENSGSVGLGLAISQNLAHLMNGDIGVTSEEGQGSCFTFELPLERGRLTAYSETINRDMNVLVVDDEIAVCEHTAILLHNMGITAEIADNGLDAVRMVKANIGTEREFDGAIIDC